MQIFGVIWRKKFWLHRWVPQWRGTYRVLSSRWKKIALAENFQSNPLISIRLPFDELRLRLQFTPTHIVTNSDVAAWDSAKVFEKFCEEAL